MKQKVLQFAFLLFIVAFHFQSQGQVKITQADFPRAKEFIDSVRYIQQVGISNPEEGPDLVWDYSALLPGELRTFEHFDATNDPNFQNVLNYRNSALNFQGFIIENINYEAIDSSGFYDYGRSIKGVTYSIRQITGGQNDSLHFVGRNEKFEGRIDDLRFPLSYQDMWSNTRIEYFNFELTVAGFGLNKTPGTRKSIINESREVVGYGGLIIPKSDGTPSALMDVLLVKVNRTRVDSFFLGGAPAPPQLMAAFGLTQGAVANSQYYNFYKPGFAGRVLDIGQVNSTTAQAFYRPQAADGLSTVHNLNHLANFNHFPNPVSAGQSVTLSSDINIELGTVSIMDMTGRTLYQTSFDSSFSKDIQLDIPYAISSGMYLYHVNDQNGMLVGVGKLMIN